MFKIGQECKKYFECKNFNVKKYSDQDLKKPIRWTFYLNSKFAKIAISVKRDWSKSQKCPFWMQEIHHLKYSVLIGQPGKIHYLRQAEMEKGLFRF